MGASRLTGGARALALEIAAEARAEWGFASDLIARGFRAHRELSSGDRRLCAETVYGLIRMDRRLDAILEELLGGEPVAPHARDDLKLLVYEARSGIPVAALAADARRVGAAIRPGGDAVDLERAVAEEAGLGARRGLDREAVRLSYPTWLIELFAADLGQDEAFALAEAMNRRAPMAVRANTGRIARDQLALRLADEQVASHPTPLSPDGLIFDTRVNAFALAAFRDGLFELMDEGSQLVAELVAPPPGGRVADACAGAGGKTLAIGARLGGKGRILALDTDGKKLEELRRRARRAGLTNLEARQVDQSGKPAGQSPPLRPGGFDRVLVDAPCSGLCTLRRNPEARWRLTRAAVEAFPARQLALLVDYAPLCAVGGRLIYATCTVARVENDAVVARFLAERADFVQVPVKEIWGRERAEQVGDGSVLRLLPQRHDTDGFFAAVLRRVR
ncbi:MAG TPA: RsmB/NOP family class I SAM-dependent RNA methyltransferase, partial [Polyangia bacterium]|nr:RsmB/NOP family class I SAM-dependent RNA methyltransferase [Polyangia bacterium]